MSNPSKEKGTRAETAFVNWARAHGFPNAERRALSGSADKGDVLLQPGFIAEVKNHARWSDLQLASWVAETLAECVNAGATLGVLIVKRPGHGDPGEWWAVTTYRNRIIHLYVDDYFSLMRERGWGEPR